MLLLSYLIHFKLTDTALNGFAFVSMNGITVTLRVRVDIISKKLVDSFKLNKTGWSLAFNINGNMGQVQV